LSLDSTKYGSRTLESDLIRNKVLKKGIKKLYKILFNGTVTEEELSGRIETIINLPISGLVAQLEKNIAANATCLVLAGGGSYQGSVSNLYKHYSKEKKTETMSDGAIIILIIN